MDIILQADRANDLCYIALSSGAVEKGVVARTVRVTDDIALDFTEGGQLAGIDVQNASSILGGDYARLSIDALVGVKEAAEMAGVHRSNFIRDYANKAGFPIPVSELANGRIWLRSQVAEYVRARGLARPA